MTVLAAIQKASTVIGLDVPALVYGSTEREHIELGILANEMADQICEIHDWSKLKFIGSVTGDGVSTSFNLPTDYLRMPKTAMLRSTGQVSPFQQIVDLDEWLENEISGFTGAQNQWIIYDGKLQIRPVLANGKTVKFTYVRNIVKSGGAEFTSDADTFLLDERILALGIIWQWKANKGQSYQEDMETYNNALSVAIGADKGPRTLRMGNGRQIAAEVFAFPRTIQ